MGRICAKHAARYASQPGSGCCLAHLAGMDLFDARCGLDGKGYTKASYQPAHMMLLPRSGAYLVKVNGHESFMDSTSVLVMRPGDELRVAHPLGCGDTFTAIELSPELADEWPVSGPQLPVDDQLDLRHRAMVAACRRGVDGLAVADQVHALLDQLLTRRDDRAAGAGRPATLMAHRRLIAHAREALVAGGFAVGLGQLAAAVGCSPHHLSRVFRQVTGETLTAYRNRLRVRAVLADLQDGADNLRTLAADYGFADQAHLTRVVRGQLGQPPGAVRRMLAGPVNRA
jgi:AraC-like DNA-binding protein